jgi:hypothetical protein
LVEIGSVVSEENTFFNFIPLFLFLAWWPSWLEGVAIGHNFERDPHGNHYCQVWFNSKLCPIATPSNQDGHQAKNRKRGMKLKKVFSSETTEPISTKLCQVWFNLVQRFQRRRFKCDMLSKSA